MSSTVRKKIFSTARGGNSINTSTYIPEVQSWISRLNGGLPSNTYITNLTNLITTLINSGDWAHIIKMYIVTQETRAWWLNSIKNPAYAGTGAAIEVGGLTYDNKGIISNGTTGYVDLNFYLGATYSGTANITNYGFGCWKITDSAQDTFDMGCQDNTFSPSADSYIKSHAVAGTMRGAVNGSDGISALVGNNSGTELQSIQVVSGTGTGYNKGVSVGTFSGVNYHIPGQSMFAMAFNASGTATSFRTDKYAMFFMEDGQANHLNIQTAYKTFATANGY